MRRTEVFLLIGQERERQERLRELGRFKHTCASNVMSHGDKCAVIGEEYGEVCGAALQDVGLALDRTHADLKKELVHLAAVAVAWLEAL